MLPDPFAEWGLSGNALAASNRRVLGQSSSAYSSSAGLVSSAQQFTPFEPLSCLLGSICSSSTGQQTSAVASPYRSSRSKALLSWALLPVNGRVSVQESSISSSGSPAGGQAAADDGSIIVSGQYHPNTGVNSTCWGSVTCTVNSINDTNYRPSPQQGSPEQLETGTQGQAGSSDGTLPHPANGSSTRLGNDILIAAAVVGSMLLGAATSWGIVVMRKRKQEDVGPDIMQDQQQQEQHYLDKQPGQDVIHDLVPLASEAVLEPSPLLSLTASANSSQAGSASSSAASNCQGSDTQQQQQPSADDGQVTSGDSVLAGNMTLTRRTAALRHSDNFPGSAGVIATSLPTCTQNLQHPALAATAQAGNRQVNGSVVWPLVSNIGPLSPREISFRLNTSKPRDNPSGSVSGSGAAAAAATGAASTGWANTGLVDKCQGDKSAAAAAAAVAAIDLAAQQVSAASRPALKQGLLGETGAEAVQGATPQQTPRSKNPQPSAGKQQAAERLAKASAAYGAASSVVGSQQRRRPPSQQDKKSKSVGQLKLTPACDMTAGAATGHLATAAAGDMSGDGCECSAILAHVAAGLGTGGNCSVVSHSVKCW